MKKLFLTILVVIALSINVSAQYKPFQFGLKINPGISWIQLDSDGISGNTSNFCFDWGFFGSYYFVENYGITSGFNVFSIKGEYSYFMPKDANNKVVTSLDARYVEIPLALTMRTDKMGNLRIFGKVGYGFGILTSSNNNITYKGNIETDLQEPDLCNIRNSLIIGIGVEYNVFKSSLLTAAFVFNDNFTNVIKDSHGGNHNIKMNTVGLELGFVF